MLNPDDLILKGRYGQILKARQELGQNHISSERESILEEIRSSEFSDKPSRLSSNFAFRNMDVANIFHKTQCPHGFFYEVEFVGPVAPCHIGDLNGVEPLPKLRGLPDEMRKQARRYWSGEFFTLIGGPNPCEEILSERHLTVLRRIS
tara:strand:+ start:202 stop:645 length:444 start_codon:yes stop_codon:yes gene_type:complete